jgi:hypothetical protein
MMEGRLMFFLVKMESINYSLTFPIMTKSNSWNGFEIQKEKLTTLALRYKEADAILEAKVGYEGAFEHTVRAYKTPHKPNNIEGIATGSALNELVSYHNHLVLELGLDYHMVREVWNGILGNGQRV